MTRYMVALKTVPYASAGWPVVLRLPDPAHEATTPEEKR